MVDYQMYPIWPQKRFPNQFFYRPSFLPYPRNAQIVLGNKDTPRCTKSGYQQKSSWFRDPATPTEGTGKVLIESVGPIKDMADWPLPELESRC
jgi:hypothetical protein